MAGISHRRPVVRAVGFHTAAQLVAGGVPLVIRHLDAGSQSSPAGALGAMAGQPASRV